MKGITQLENTIEQVRQNLDRADLRVAGVLCTMTDHTNVAGDVAQAIRNRFGDLTFRTVIPKNIKVEEAHSRTESVLTYAPASKGVAVYQELVKEVLECG